MSERYYQKYTSFNFNNVLSYPHKMEVPYSFHNIYWFIKKEMQILVPLSHCHSMQRPRALLSNRLICSQHEDSILSSASISKKTNTLLLFPRIGPLQWEKALLRTWHIFSGACSSRKTLTREPNLTIFVRNFYQRLHFLNTQVESVPCWIKPMVSVSLFGGHNRNSVMPRRKMENQIPNGKRAMEEELNRGRDMANQLLEVLAYDKSITHLQKEEEEGSNSVLPFVEDLVRKVLCSFTNTLLLLNSTNDVSHEVVASITLRDVSSSTTTSPKKLESVDEICKSRKILSTENRRRGYKRKWAS